MSKFCENCGAEMDDNETICKYCGPKAEEKVEEPVVETKGANESTSTPAQNDTKKMAIIGGAIIAAVIVLLIIIFSIVGGRYKAPIKNLVKGTNKADADIYLKAYPEFLDMGKTIDDEYLKDKIKDNEKDYGDNLKYSCKILGKEKIDKDDLKYVQDYIKETYDEKVEIKKGFEVKLEKKYKGKDDFDYYTSTAYVYKIDGKWKILDVSPEYAKKSAK